MVFSWVLDEAGPLFFIAAAIILAGGIFLVIQLLRFLPFSQRKARRQGFAGRAIKVLGSGCVFLFGLLVMVIVLFAQTYEAFTREEPVARIQCVSVEGLDYDMVLRFVPVKGGKEGDPRLFRLNGDQWSVGGHILQWHSWLNLLGLHTGYRITRIEGRYLKAEDEASAKQTVFDLGESRTERIWHWLYRHHEEIPLVKAAYGNTAYTFPEENQTFLVMVTGSGFKVAPGQKR